MAEQLDQPLSTGGVRRLRLGSRTSRSDGFGRFAEATARFMGSPRFVLYMTVFVGAWIVANLLLAIGARPVMADGASAPSARRIVGARSVSWT